MLGVTLSKPDCPPSPPTDSTHVGEPLSLHVPLSCVPPSRSPVGFAGLNDSDWNWMVFSPSLIGSIADGMPLRSGGQTSRSSAQSGLPPNLRVLHAADLATVVETLMRTTPPSE